MSSYLTTFIAVTVLTHLAVFGLRLLTSDKAEPKQVWAGTDKSYSFLAGVASMLLVALIDEGWNSPIFAIAAVSIVVAAILVSRIQTLKAKLEMQEGSDGEESVRLVDEVIKFSQTWAGSVVYGALFGAIVTIPNWSEKTRALTDIPSKDESRIYLIVFSVIVFLSLVILSRLNRGAMRRLPTASRIRRVVGNGWLLPAILGVVFALIQNQTRNATFANRYFIIAVIAWIAIAELWALVMVLPGSRAKLKAEKEHFDEQQKKLKRKKRKKSRR